MSRQLIRRGRGKLLQKLIRLRVVHNSEDRLILLGSGYGGWWVPSTLATSKSTIVSVGVGEDTTFDEALLERGCLIWALDPTPRAQDHVRKRKAAGALEGTFQFWPVGLWHRDEILRFYAPSDPTHVSHSVVNAQATDTWFEAECWSLEHVMAAAGLPSLDVLKLDIEGAEVQVLAGLLAMKMRPRALCVELDAPLPERRTFALLSDLRSAGYRLAHADGWNLVFVHPTATEARSS